MANVTWKCFDGTTVSAEVPNGLSLMEAAVNANVAGIYGDCGGAMSCATCHVVVDEEWYAKVGAPSAMEEDLLEMVPGGRTPRSRLSCQIRVSDELDGIVLETVA
ncbi:2Fe-2S iron-sulfur cluster-binding protein [Zestomonas thermotolerans]|uniref:2Fe-2S iron-sulfur cluster-binding protein n=1 Tax=Zestomonas thermotolerans TaxID=157784 RepID=UPI000480287E|nr:2Fe-2S iron-sulfur cluster-binding protein [Pseudomonas thermotolerans]